MNQKVQDGLVHVAITATSIVVAKLTLDALSGIGNFFRNRTETKRVEAANKTADTSKATAQVAS